MPLLHRIVRTDSPVICFTIDGAPCEGRAGDTVLTAVLCHGDRLRHSEFSGAPRAGFCQMGACQDCWVQLEGGERLRACTTELTEGMQIVTQRGRSHG
ncbi:(2Fe-2S)-binding protein [Bradyrhizobium sp. 83002]|uniref:(2Fe-2S)-binding protein n=1 Tax=Bradyrhizobium aeschynomenes TaxID=2734909 RepID=UPI0015569585|nr:(2Fe-2S)-binding protein [Bradyrhizobium aeschynomenes]NPU09207.1 (2Fe-2S)-binding protein [Bradyrhizobium aeschynomenes]NPV25454.1 (2Fe-2S)-binding protein [Bradyrhizobium aeschynomenes]